MPVMRVADKGVGNGELLVRVREIVTRQWAQYGRYFYCWYSYVGINSETANRVIDTIRVIPGDPQKASGSVILNVPKLQKIKNVVERIRTGQLQRKSGVFPNGEM